MHCRWNRSIDDAGLVMPKPPPHVIDMIDVFDECGKLVIQPFSRFRCRTALNRRIFRRPTWKHRIPREEFYGVKCVNLAFHAIRLG